MRDLKFQLESINANGATAARPNRDNNFELVPLSNSLRGAYVKDMETGRDEIRTSTPDPGTVTREEKGRQPLPSCSRRWGGVYSAHSGDVRILKHCSWRY